MPNQWVALGITAVLVVVLIGSVVLPTAYDMTTRTADTATNATACTDVNTTGSCQRIWDLTDPYTSGTTLLNLTTSVSSAAENVTIRTTGGVVLCTLNTTTPYYCSVDASYIDSSTSTLTLNFNSTNATSTADITAGYLHYDIEADSDDWGSAAVVLFALVPFVIVVAGLLFFI